MFTDIVGRPTSCGGRRPGVAGRSRPSRRVGARVPRRHRRSRGRHRRRRVLRGVRRTGTAVRAPRRSSSVPATSASTSAPVCTSGSARSRGDRYAGIAVHTGARIAALAGAGEVLASRTVKDLVAGQASSSPTTGCTSSRGSRSRGRCTGWCRRSAAVADEPVPRVERGGRVHGGHGEARHGPPRAPSASASQSGTGARSRSLGTGRTPVRRARRCTDRASVDLLRRVGGPDPLERLGVGLAVGAHAVDPDLVDGHRVARRRS